MSSNQTERKIMERQARLLLRGRTQEELSKPVVAFLVKTCDALPSQWHGITQDGKFVYIRYRYGSLTVEVGPHWLEQVFELDCGSAWSGFMEDDEMQQHTSDVLDWSCIASDKDDAV